MYFAQARIEHGSVIYNPGDQVPEGIPGFDDLLEHGSIGPAKPSRQVTVDTDGNIVDGGGAGYHPIRRWAGDVTAEDIADPAIDTDSAYLGVHFNEADHREQEPHIYAALDAADTGDAGEVTD